MADRLIDLGLAMRTPDTSTGAKTADYDDSQINLMKYVTIDLLYEHTPNFNGGYIVVVDPGPWIDIVDKDPHLNDKYGSKISEYKNIIKEFIKKSPRYVYTIDPGSVSAGADNYNLRHMNQNVFAYETKISNFSLTYLDEFNIIEIVHHLWYEFMRDLKKGHIDLADIDSKWLARDTDIFYPVPYYGQVYAYAYNPVDLRPREIIKYIGIWPSSENLSDSFGQRGQNNHYMKNIQYYAVDYERHVY